MPSPTALRQELRFAHVASGARIAWARSGRGPPLLRAGHWMTHLEHDAVSALFRPWLERLGRGVTVYRYDERGCGLSGVDDVPPGLASSVEEIGAVVDAAGLDRVALLGISGGAAPSIAYAARHPERVSHLVVLGGYSHGLLHRALGDAQRAYLEAQARLIELGWGVRDAPVQQFFTATMIPDATPEQAAALNEQQRRSCDGRRAAALFRSRLALDVRDEIAAVRCPTLVLHAEGDAAVAVESGRELAAAIPGARFESLRTRNHVPLAGEPAFDRFCEAVAEFIGPGAAQVDGRAFTPRERELLTLVARGCDNLQIAAQLGLAEKTVRNALSSLYTRLGVDGRTHAVVRARELGFS
ncbi:alpha/beta fold hydrolase [Ideonella sp. A 288]|uniref:alpha/beta fold hydrolase n=1 Tax=Ideonella sp. A 288 TaxID=1962181 RepID=UPI00118613D5|nr:alpha/beta fold hydrolase [Ideonella sp. A 288]